MNSTISGIPQRFAEVVQCDRCVAAGEAKILHDRRFHVPQPGYIGRNFAGARVLLVGQNPGVSPERFRDQDQRYANALNALTDDPSDACMAPLQRLLEEIIPTWPVSGSYFPLQECGLRLQDIAYVNLVRCRTTGNAMPSSTMTERCKQLHFAGWLDWLEPRVVVCVGKWAHDQIAGLLDTRGIQHAFVNRMRSLSSAERQANVAEVVGVVRAALGRSATVKPVPVVETALSPQPVRETEKETLPGTESARATGMNFTAYEVMLRKLGFTRVELTKILLHPGLRITVYVNRDQTGLVSFVAHAKDGASFKPDLWEIIAPRKVKDDKPGFRTLVPKPGCEMDAFRDLLRG